MPHFPACVWVHIYVNVKVFCTPALAMVVGRFFVVACCMDLGRNTSQHKSIIVLKA